MKYALSPLTNGGPHARVSSPFFGCSILMTRAHIGQQHRAVRTRQHARQIENGDTVKGRTHMAESSPDIIVYSGSA